MTIPTAYEVKIVKGKVHWRDRQGLALLMPMIEGKRMVVTFHDFSRPRSLDQNAYFWGVVVDRLSEFTGFEKREMKILLQFMFLSRKAKNGRLYVRGTSRLTRREFSEFLECVIRWAAIDLGCYIPPPESCQESYAIDDAAA